MTVPQHTNSVPRKLNEAEKHRKNYYERKKKKRKNSTHKHFMGPSRHISIPLKVLAFVLEKCENGLPITKDNMNEGNGSHYISEDPTVRFQSQ